MQSIPQQFWQNWMKLYFPGLVTRQKWHVERRNVCIGDICVIKDSNVIRGEWRLGQITAVYPDRLGKVRNVEVSVKPKQGGLGEYVPTIPLQLRRHVNNVIVLIPVEDQNVGSDKAAAVSSSSQ